MPLTWRDVAAPDFGPALQGYQTFASLFGNAISGAERGLARYDSTISDRVNNQIQMRLAAATDAAQAQDIAAGLATDPNAARISAGTIAAAGARPDALIARALNQDNLQFTSGQHTRTVRNQGAEDAAAPFAQAYLEAQSQGPAAVAAFHLAHPDFGAGMTLAGQTQLFTGGQDARSKALSIEGQGISNTGGQTSNEMSAFNLNVARQDRTADQQAKSVLANLGLQELGPEDLNAYFSSHPEISANAQLLVRAGLGGGISTGGGTGGGSGSSGSGGSGGSGGGALADVADFSNVPFSQVRDRIGGGESDAVGGYGALAYDTGPGQNASGVRPPKPIQQMTMGELYDFQRGPMRNATRGRRGQDDVGSTGAGRYQFESETLRQNAEQTFGNNWRNMPFSPENQDRVAETLYNRVRGDRRALGTTWRAFGLTPGREQLRTGQVLTQLGAGNQTMQNNAGDPTAAAIIPAMSSTESKIQVAERLAGSPTFKGVDRGTIMNFLDQIVTQANSGDRRMSITPAVAGEMLSRGIKTNNSIIPNRFNSDALSTSGGTNTGLAVDRDAISQMVTSLQTGQYQRTYQQQTGIGERQTQVTQLTQAAEQARQRYTEAQRAALRNPSYSRDKLDRLRQEAEAAIANAQIAQGAQGASLEAGGNRPFGAPVVVPTVRRPAPAPAAPPVMVAPSFSGRGPLIAPPLPPQNPWLRPSTGIVRSAQPVDNRVMDAFRQAAWARALSR